VRIGDGPAHDVVVDNEYQDANSGHRPLLLALVLRALHDYRDGDGFEAWCKEQFLDSEHPRFRELYQLLGPAAEAFAARFEPLLPVDGYSWSVNSDAAQALRRIADGEV